MRMQSGRSSTAPASGARKVRSSGRGGAEYDKPEPVRICYPNVAVHDRAVHFFGVSDIIEPYKAWRDFKRELTGQQWDYDFRRLFYTWTRDITKEPFNKWVEIASRDKTCGRVFPGDLWLAPPDMMVRVVSQQPFQLHPVSFVKFASIRQRGRVGGQERAAQIHPHLRKSACDVTQSGQRNHPRFCGKANAFLHPHHLGTGNPPNAQQDQELY